MQNQQRISSFAKFRESSSGLEAAGSANSSRDKLTIETGNSEESLVSRQRRKSYNTHSPYSSPKERRKSSVKSPSQVTDEVFGFTELPSSFTSFDMSVYQNRQMLQKQPTVVNVTCNILQVYSAIDPSLKYLQDNNPRRVLTKPSKPAHNHGFDNDDYDYILYVNDILGDLPDRQYLILDLLGQGTFGQVVKCKNLLTNEIVAVKVIKNKPAYYNQSKIEVTLLEMLNQTYDIQDKHHMARVKDSFDFRSHLCIVFEVLSVNLYELIKQNNYKGLSSNLVRVFVSQILDCLRVLSAARVIHCDLKPENILLKDLDSPNIKVVDFGSACYDTETVYTYIQSRFYRSPEVLLGLPYNSQIDMWSLGCIAAELFLGLPLFPGTSEYNQIYRIVEIMGLPSFEMCENGKSAKNFFKKIVYPDGHSQYVLKTIEEYSIEAKTQEQPSKKYFKGNSLDELILQYPISSKKTPPEVEREISLRVCFLDFLKGVLSLEASRRWTPEQAIRHPFITGEPFTGPYIPPGMYPYGYESTGPTIIEPSPAYQDSRRRKSSLSSSDSRSRRVSRQMDGYIPQINDRNFMRRGVDSAENMLQITGNMAEFNIQSDVQPRILPGFWNSSESISSRRSSIPNRENFGNMMEGQRLYRGNLSDMRRPSQIQTQFDQQLMDMSRTAYQPGEETPVSARRNLGMLSGLRDKAAVRKQNSAVESDVFDSREDLSGRPTNSFQSVPPPNLAVQAHESMPNLYPPFMPMSAPVNPYSQNINYPPNLPPTDQQKYPYPGMNSSTNRNSYYRQGQ